MPGTGQTRWTGKGRASGMARRAAFCLAVLAFLAGPSASAHAETPKPRAASASICADQYLLALADPEQIASLSWQAMGPLSTFAEEAAAYPSNRGGAEEFLDANVEILILNSHGSMELRRIMGQFDVEMVVIATTTITFDEIAQSVRDVAAKLDQTARGEALIADMQARLARIDPQVVEEDAGPSVTYFRPEGGGAGAGTFVDTALRHAGFRNLQADLGNTGWGRVPLEQLVLTPPDGLVTSFFDTAYKGVNARFSSHSLFTRLSAEKPVMPVPGRYWTCAGPMLIDAVESLAAQRREHFGGGHD